MATYPPPFTTGLFKFSVRFPGLLFLKSFERITFVSPAPQSNLSGANIFNKGQQVAMVSYSGVENWRSGVAKIFCIGVAEIFCILVAEIFCIGVAEIFCK